MVVNIKKIGLSAAGIAFQKHMQGLTGQQEIVAAISNIIMEAFAAESAQLRTRKMAEGAGGAGILPTGSGSRLEAGAPRQAQDITEALIHESLDRAEAEARAVLAASAEGDTLRTQMAVLRRLTRRDPIDSIATKRRIAARVLEAEKYLV